MRATESIECSQVIERGGEICMASASDGAEMRQQLLMAIGISTLFAGGLVHLKDWLPGLILKVQALRSLNDGDQVSIDRIWPSMYAQLSAWIECPADADLLDLSFDGAHCVLIPDVFTWHAEPAVFTLSCVLASQDESRRHIMRCSS